MSALPRQQPPLLLLLMLRRLDSLRVPLWLVLPPFLMPSAVRWHQLSPLPHLPLLQLLRGLVSMARAVACAVTQGQVAQVELLLAAAAASRVDLMLR